MLEKIGAYAAGELEGEEAREAEQLIFERPDYQRLAESYARMLVMLMRYAEFFLSSLGRSYLDALVYYFGLRPQRPESYGGGI